MLNHGTVQVHRWHYSPGAWVTQVLLLWAQKGGVPICRGGIEYQWRDKEKIPDDLTYNRYISRRAQNCLCITVYQEETPTTLKKSGNFSKFYFPITPKYRSCFISNEQSISFSLHDSINICSYRIKKWF